MTVTIAPPKVSNKKMLIGGQWVDSVSGKTFETINPATGSPLLAVSRTAFLDPRWGIRP